jgi:hypothetical protein
MFLFGQKQVSFFTPLKVAAQPGGEAGLKHGILKISEKIKNAESYVAKARSGFFENKSSTKAMSTMDAFRECAKANTGAAHFWLDRLYVINDAALKDWLTLNPLFPRAFAYLHDTNLSALAPGVHQIIEQQFIDIVMHHPECR